MSNRLFQGIVHQMREAIDRTIGIMDETHTILACGASAVTKLKEPNGNYIERIFNYKYPYEYIDRFEEMINRKSGIEKFYNEHPIK